MTLICRTVVPFFKKNEKVKNYLSTTIGDKFAQDIKNKKHTLITDTMRDAHQSLLATRMRTDDLINIAEFYSNNLSTIFNSVGVGQHLILA